MEVIEVTFCSKTTPSSRNEHRKIQKLQCSFITFEKRQFEDRMISRNSIRGRDWPARSPDLNPLDFFLWGYLKSQVYKPWPNSLDDLESEEEWWATCSQG